jgi:DNA helicase-2/ATP-dependent DNA helicase PcrA
METEKLSQGLNEEQVSAVKHGGGPLLIVAGAGTGKTTVIVNRIAWLIESGQAKAENILALTFTDKAAGEMEERVDKLLPYGYVELQISTFHAFCEKLLREYGAEMGMPRDFNVLTELDAWLLVRAHLDRFDLDHFRPMGNPTRHLRSLISHFSRLKDAGITTDQYLTFAQEMEADLDAKNADEEATAEVKRVKELAGAYHTYQQILAEAASLDFGDLIAYAVKLLKDRPTVLKEVRERFSFVLVDEFQDTNLAQYELVKLIAAPKNNLTVVGDDDQSIYAFRGASLANILRFETDFPDAARVVLVKNYRSVQQILDKAHGFIQANNPNRLEAKSGLSKKLHSSREEAGVVEHLHFKTLDEETAAVARKILELNEAGVDWNDIAILVRGNDSAVPFLAALDRRRIPYQFLAMRGLYVKPAVLDVVAYLHVLDDPFDSPSVYRCLTHPRLGLDHATISELSHFANRKGKSLYEACQAARHWSELPPEQSERLRAFLDGLDKLRPEALKRKAPELFVKVVHEAGFLAYIEGLKDRAKAEAFGELNQFHARMKSFEERHDSPVLRHFLEEFAHERDAGEEGTLAPDMESGPDMVKVMTVHASKGLEFRHVFVVGMVDRRFPTDVRREAIPIPDGLADEGEKSEDWHLEEERRLFYVAMTRAKEGLYFTSAEDYGGARKRKISRFLAELGYSGESVRPSAAADLFTPVDEDSGGVVLAERETIIHVPKHFSFSQLVAFRSCPLQYKFAHVLKIPVFGKGTFSFGKTMHNTLQSFLVTWMERTGKQQATLFGETAKPKEGELPVSLDELYAMYAESWQDDWFRDDKERETYRESGKESLARFYALCKTAPPKPIGLEKAFSLKIGDITLKGRIDRIDACEDGVEIIDYKTGTPKTEDGIKKEDKEQLYLYQMAAEDLFGYKVKRLTYHYLKDHTTVSFLGSPDELLDLKEQIVERVARIRESNFSPTPSEFTCKFCDFKDICEYSKA